MCTINHCRVYYVPKLATFMEWVKRRTLTSIRATWYIAWRLAMLSYSCCFQALFATVLEHTIQKYLLEHSNNRYYNHFIVYHYVMHSLTAVHLKRLSSICSPIVIHLRWPNSLLLGVHCMYVSCLCSLFPSLITSNSKPVLFWNRLPSPFSCLLEVTFCPSPIPAAPSS